MLCAPHGLGISAFDPLGARWDDLLGLPMHWSDQGSVVTPPNVRLMAYRSRFASYIRKTLVSPIGGRSSISNKQRGLRRCRSFPWTPSSWSKRKSWRQNAFRMLSIVLLLIQRALITRLHIFHQRSLLPSDVNFASIIKTLPAFSGVFYCLIG